MRRHTSIYTDVHLITLIHMPLGSFNALTAVTCPRPDQKSFCRSLYTWSCLVYACIGAQMSETIAFQVYSSVGRRCGWQTWSHPVWQSPCKPTHTCYTTSTIICFQAATPVMHGRILPINTPSYDTRSKNSRDGRGALALEWVRDSHWSRGLFPWARR